MLTPGPCQSWFLPGCLKGSGEGVPQMGVLEMGPAPPCSSSLPRLTSPLGAPLPTAPGSGPLRPNGGALPPAAPRVPLRGPHSGLMLQPAPPPARPFLCSREWHSCERLPGLPGRGPLRPPGTPRAPTFLFRVSTGGLATGATTGQGRGGWEAPGVSGPAGARGGGWRVPGTPWALGSGPSKTTGC